MDLVRTPRAPHKHFEAISSRPLLLHGVATQTKHAGQARLIITSTHTVQRPEFRWVNTILGNLKAALSGTYHAIDHAKYAHRYLAEFAYRFNRRFNLAAMVPRLLRAAVTTKPLPLSVLRLTEAGN